MKIGVISDTHGNVAALDQALAYLGQVDLVIHAGDVLYHPPRLGFIDGYDIPAFVERLNSLSIPVVIAQGNCDAQVYEELLDMPVQSPYALAELNGIRVVTTHGHLLTRQQMIDTASRYRADYFISGHTHIPLLEKVGDVTFMNPGSPAIPKYEVDGVPVPSVGMISEKGARIVSIKDGSTMMELQR